MWVKAISRKTGMPEDGLRKKAPRSVPLPLQRPNHFPKKSDRRQKVHTTKGTGELLRSLPVRGGGKADEARIPPYEKARRVQSSTSPSEKEKVAKGP